MDSLKLINASHSKVTKNKEKTSLGNQFYPKLKTIIFIIFCILNLYTFYRTFRLNSKIEQIYYALSNSNILTNNNISLTGVINNQLEKGNNDENIMEEYIK